MNKLPTAVALSSLILAIGCNTDTGGDGSDSGPVTVTITVTSADLAVDDSDVAANPGKWYFYNDENDTIDNGLGSFVTGPASTPAGTGSVEISVMGTQRRNLATSRFGGTALADITTFAYSTYNPVAGNGGDATRSAYLNFNVDFDGSGGWQSRLVYVPRDNGSVSQDAWQEWDVIDSGNALWRYSGGTWPDGDTNATRTWSDILATFSGISLHTEYSWLGLRVGEPYANGYTENIDAFKFATDGSIELFDFE